MMSNVIIKHNMYNNHTIISYWCKIHRSTRSSQTKTLSSSLSFRADVL